MKEDARVNRKNPLSSNQPMRKEASKRAVHIPSEVEEAGKDRVETSSADGEGDSDEANYGEEDTGEAEPALSEIERKRKLNLKRETKSGKHRGGGQRLSTEPKVRPEQRIPRLHQRTKP